MYKVIVIAVVATITMFFYFPHWIGLQDRSFAFPVRDTILSTKIPVDTCFPENDSFTEKATAAFQEGMATNNSPLKPLSLFVSCSINNPFANAAATFPWGFIATHETDVTGITQKQLSAIIAARLRIPTLPLQVEGLSEESPSLNDVATSVLLIAGAAGQKTGLLGDADVQNDSSVFEHSETTAIVSTEGITEVGNTLRDARISVGSTVLDDQVMSIVIFGISDRTSRDEDIELIKNFSDSLLEQYKG